MARAVANELGYRHIDSGAMYRAVGWKALRDGVPLDEEAAVAALAAGARIGVSSTLVTIDGIDVTRIRTRRSIVPPPLSPACRPCAASWSSSNARWARTAGS